MYNLKRALREITPESLAKLGFTPSYTGKAISFYTKKGVNGNCIEVLLLGVTRGVEVSIGQCSRICVDSIRDIRHLDRLVLGKG